MLDADRHEVTAARRIEGLGRAAQREVVGLGAAAREDNFVRVGVDECRHRRARLVQFRFGELAIGVDGRWIAVAIGQRASDGGDDLREGRRGGIVIEVDAHDCPS